MAPVRDSDGDLVGRAVPFTAGDPAVPLAGDEMGGPIRTADGELVGRTALYQVSGGVAVPVTELGGTASEQVSADAPLVATPSGDNVVLSVTIDQAGGVPLLDGTGLIKLSQMPISGLNYHGNWDASTNTPTLADGAGTAGDMYRVHVAGTQDLGGGAITFDVGDLVVYEGNLWQKFEAATGVISVNGKTGAVELVKADVGLGNVDNTADLSKPISTATQTALDAKADESALTAHTGNTNNPHAVTKAQVGLSNVDNTADADKPISTATQAALDAKLTTPTLTTAVVLGTTLEGNTIGLVGYGQDNLGDTLAMRQLGGQISTATPSADTDAATKSYVDTAVAGVSGGAAAWGAITGTLSDQTDLQQALDGRVLLTSKATEADATAGTADDKWMTPLGTKQAIDAAAASAPETYTDFKTTDTDVSDPTPQDALFGVTPSASNPEDWSVEWRLYVSASAPGGAQLAVVPQTGLTLQTSGVGAAPGSTGGSPMAMAADGALDFQADTSVRLIHLTTYLSSTVQQNAFEPLRLTLASPDSVDITVHAGSHVVAHKLLTAT